MNKTSSGRVACLCGKERRTRHVLLCDAVWQAVAEYTIEQGGTVDWPHVPPVDRTSYSLWIKYLVPAFRLLSDGAAR